VPLRRMCPSRLPRPRRPVLQAEATRSAADVRRFLLPAPIVQRRLMPPGGRRDAPRTCVLGAVRDVGRPAPALSRIRSSAARILVGRNPHQDCTRTDDWLGRFRRQATSHRTLTAPAASLMAQRRDRVQPRRALGAGGAARGAPPARRD